MTVPYILGCLAFREVPFFLKVYETVDTDVDVWFFDIYTQGIWGWQHMREL